MNNYQITLFFDKDTSFKSIELSNSLLENVNEIGDPIILPSNQHTPKGINLPIIIFNKNEKIQITVNYYSITINIEKDDTIIIKDLVLNVNEALIKNEIVVVRIGYGYKTQLNNELIDNFKQYYFSKEDIKKSINFELSWLTEIIINNLNVNCWQRYYTEQDSKFLNVIFDINTKAEEYNDINRNFLETFIDESDKYIKDKLFK